MTIIIGAGISGLVLAYHLHRLQKPYLLVEASNRVGGYLQSVVEGNYLFEMAANSILADAEIVDFLHTLGLQEQILYPNTSSNKRYILKNGKYAALPSSPPALLWNNFFSWKTKYKILKEFANKTSSPEAETVAEFFDRHFGKEIVEYAVNPFVMGIYAGNPEKLLIAKTFPQLLDLEKQYGSILKGFIKNKSAQRKLSLNFREGMETLPKAIAKNLNIRFQTKVISIKHTTDNTQADTKKYTITAQEISQNIESIHKHITLQADNIVITSPSFQTQEFVAQLFPEFAKALQKIYYPPLTVVHSVFKKSAVGLQLDGFGALHPKIENAFSAGTIWTSSVVENRCPIDEIMLTSFIGGAVAPEKAALDDAVLVEKLNEELNKLYKITEKPILQRITRWKNAIPQYDEAMLETDKQIENLAKQQIFVCANWNLGVSLADAMHKGKALAEKLALV